MRWPRSCESWTSFPSWSGSVKSGAGVPASINVVSFASLKSVPVSIASGTSRPRRAIGIVRVSQVNGRDGERFASPGEQADRIRRACDRDDLKLVEVIEELDVSGGTALEQRHGLRRAVEAV